MGGFEEEMLASVTNQKFNCWIQALNPSVGPKRKIQAFSLALQKLKKTNGNLKHSGDHQTPLLLRDYSHVLTREKFEPIFGVFHINI